METLETATLICRDHLPWRQQSVREESLLTGTNCREAFVRGSRGKNNASLVKYFACAG